MKIKIGKLFLAAALLLTAVLPGWAEVLTDKGKSPDINLSVIPEKMVLESGQQYQFYFASKDGTLVNPEVWKHYRLEADEVVRDEVEHFNEFEVKFDENGFCYLSVIPDPDDHFYGMKKLYYKVICRGDDGYLERDAFPMLAYFELVDITNDIVQIDCGDWGRPIYDDENDVALFLTQANHYTTISKSLKQITFYFEKHADFQVQLGPTRAFQLYFDDFCPDVDLEMRLIDEMDAYEIYNFRRSPKFDYVGTMTIENRLCPYLYEYRGGKLYRVQSEYFDGVHTFQTNRLSCYILTDKPLERYS